eukprot:gene7732-9062_t
MEGDIVWIEHSGLVHTRARVKQVIDDKSLRVVCEEDASESTIATSTIVRANRDDIKDFDDLVGIQDLTEASLLATLRSRYKKDKIYNLDIYDKAHLQRYDGARVKGEAPHIYAVAAAAFAALITEQKSQAIVISGESGSGKTEASKAVLACLVHRSGDGAGVARDLIEATPILEAFGNATTPSNDNSSRFGKFIKVRVDPATRRIVGASLETYLLERSRLSHRPDTQHLNYHLLYYLAGGASSDERTKYALPDVRAFRYLDGDARAVERVSKGGLAASLDKVRRAMLAMSFTSVEVDAVFQACAAVLHLGNIEFIKDSTGMSLLDEGPRTKAALDTAARLLGQPAPLLSRNLLLRNLKASGRGSVYARTLTVAQAEEARDTLAKAIYTRIFSHIVARINAKLSPVAAAPSALFIGVLDIFGFENMSRNSLEQLLINFTNEKLHSTFNATVLEREQAEYVADGVAWTMRSVTDTRECIELVERRDGGLLSLLDDECMVPKGAETSLLEKYNARHMASCTSYLRSLVRGSFGIRHFAGDVVYSVDGWLEKNRDAMPPDLTELCQGSQVPFIRLLFAADDIGKQPAKGAPVAKKTGGSVAGQFQEQLGVLLTTLSSATLYYVRCIKPNIQLISDNFNSTQVLTQLRSVGLLATVQVRKMGYSYRREFASFVQRYKILMPKQALKQDVKSLCMDIIELAGLRSMGGSQVSLQIGKTKIFMTDELSLTEARKVFAVMLQEDNKKKLEEKERLRKEEEKAKKEEEKARKERELRQAAEEKKRLKALDDQEKAAKKEAEKKKKEAPPVTLVTLEIKSTGAASPDALSGDESDDNDGFAASEVKNILTDCHIAKEWKCDGATDMGQQSITE